MIHTISRYHALEGSVPRRLFVSDESKILVFERGPLVFLFNFHSQQSVSEYPVLVPPSPNGYRLVLSTDDRLFGGHDRIQPGQHFALLEEMRGNERCGIIKVYLPCRTAMVVEKVEG